MEGNKPYSYMPGDYGYLPWAVSHVGRCKQINIAFALQMLYSYLQYLKRKTIYQYFHLYGK